MDDRLIRAYYEELDFLRSLAGEFATAYPEIATRLSLSQGAAHDPHVERLINSVALMNARFRLRMDQDLPLLTDAILGGMYPHYVRPIPSVSIVRFAADPAGAPSPVAKRVGPETTVVTEQVRGTRCEFRPAWPVDVWPLEVTEATLGSTAIAPPECTRPDTARGALVLDVRSLWPEVALDQMKGLRQLRVYLHDQREGRSIANKLYEMLLTRLAGAFSVAEPVGGGAPVCRPLDVRAVGFEPGEELLPGDARAHRAHRMLTEFLALPERFRFFDIRFDPLALKGAAGSVRVVFLLREADPDLERLVGPGLFRLGCTPVVNLFRIASPDPVILDGAAMEARVVPDRRREQALEVYSVDRVRDTSGGEAGDLAPLHALGHRSKRSALYWTIRRENRLVGASEEVVSEVFLSIADRTAAPFAERRTLRVELTCFNRNIPEKLPFGPGAPRAALSEGGGTKVEFLLKPSPTRRPSLGREAISRLISQLSLNHLSLVGGEGAAEALRDILETHVEFARPGMEGCASAIHGVDGQRRTMPVGDGFAPGVLVNLVVNDRRLPEGMACLFGSVMERFFGLYCSVNSLSRMRLTLAGQSHHMYEWPPRSGDRVIL